MLAAAEEPREEQRGSAPSSPPPLLPAEPPGPPQVRYGTYCLCRGWAAPRLQRVSRTPQAQPGSLRAMAFGEGARKPPGHGAAERAGAFCSPASAALASRPPRRRARLPGASGRRPRPRPRPRAAPSRPRCPLRLRPPVLCLRLPGGVHRGKGPAPHLRPPPAPGASGPGPGGLPVLASRSSPPPPLPGRALPLRGLLRHRLPPAAEPRQEKEEEEKEKKATCPSSSSSRCPSSPLRAPVNRGVRR